MKSFKFTFFTLFCVFMTNSGLQASTCLPRAQAGLKEFSKRYIQFLCNGSSECSQRAHEILEDSLECVNSSDSVKEWRKQATAFMRDEDFKSFIETRYLKDDPSGIRKKIWQDFEILVLPGGLKTPVAQTQDWKERDLMLLLEGYRKLKEAITNAVGEDRVDEFSHIWGAGGAVARGGKEYPGLNQLGEVWNIYPLQMNVVVSLSQKRFSSEEIAQRIAHENAHSQDYLLGAIRGDVGGSWSETGEAQIFKRCELAPRYETALVSCWVDNPSWFNFHPVNTDAKKVNYASIRSAEFYSKMIDEWVRENLGLLKKSPYRCQSPVTLGLWREMEKQFLGEILSQDCSF